MAVPSCIVVLSGKRKSGKDFVADELKDRLFPWVQIGRLSAPLKMTYAKEHGLDYAQLLTAGSLKELHRSDMIKWGESRRSSDAGFFARQVMAQALKKANSAPVLVVSDARRLTDLEFFTQHESIVSGVTKLILVRVYATESSREARGWVFTPGIDDAQSECALDGVGISVGDATKTSSSDTHASLENAKTQYVSTGELSSATFEWDFVINNDGDSSSFEKDISVLISQIKLFIPEKVS